MDNRRRSPIPPPRESREFRDGRQPYRRDDRGPDRRGAPDYPGRDRRRPRSMSPDRNGRGRSPPPYKRYRREDDFYDDRAGGAGYRRSPPRRRGSPNYRGGGGGGYDDMYDPYREDPRARAPIDAERPMTFKEFMIHGVGDEDVGPDAAQARYQEYLAAWWGDHIKAEFEQRKGDEQLRARFDPRVVEKTLRMRNEAAREAAARWAEELRQGKYDPTAGGFNQGALALAPADDDSSAARAPVVTWSRTRVASDLILSRQLMQKLDTEREVAANLLAGGEQGGSSAGDMVTSDEALPFSLEGLEAALRLDLQLTYLYNVHGVDYYAGRELEPSNFSSRVSTCRMLRPPCPEDPEAAAKGAAESSVQLAKVVDECWNRRMQLGDPDKLALQLDRVERTVDDWIESQIDEEEPNKWSNKLSNKRFVGKQFVVKHIRTKHADKLEEVRSKIMEEVYFENFRAAKEAEEKEAEAAAQQQVQPPPPGGPAPMQFQPAPPPHPPPPQTAPPPRYNEDGQGFDGEGEGFGPMRSTMGPRRGAPPRMVGRGGAMMRLGRGMPMMDGPLLPMPMGGPMAPIFMPGPGPGPMGPIILAPMQPGTGPMPMPMDPFGRGRGRGMRGRGRGPFPGMMMAPGTKLDPQGYREYYDLDAPQNNRAVLDYGDL